MGSMQGYLLRVINFWPSRVVQDSRISQTYLLCFVFSLNLWISVLTAVRFDFLDEKPCTCKIHVWLGGKAPNNRNAYLEIFFSFN